MRPLLTTLALSTALFAPLNAIALGEHFESPQVHPIELSPDGSTLFAVHTPDHKLSVFALSEGPSPVRVFQVAVGLEPVTVRARSANEVWVVNHVSDSISIIDVTTGHVVRTLLVGDEPTDVVFAGGAAFVCVSQEDLIRVFDLANLAAPPSQIPLTMSDPRSLALSPDGSSLYVCALDSQNQTTAIPFLTVQNSGGPPPPTPPMAGGLPAAPDVSLIVRHDGSAWRDEANRSWSSQVPYTLLDHDVIRISTSLRSVTGTWRAVGTTLFNVAVNPVNGLLYVSNQEATNEVRFEPNLKGKFVKNRVTTIDPGSGNVTPRHLNDHINYGNPAGSAVERAQSLSIPLDMAVSSDGADVYVASMGSRKVGVLDQAGVLQRRITVGEGPTGIALDEERGRLYVVNRFSSTLSIVDLADDSSFEISLGFDPSLPEVLAGRRFLYDGEISSSHGDLSCASCHVFGAMDNVSWDLGDPQGSFVPNVPLAGFHPMKGPMATQSLKGLQGTEPLHWRGDRASFQAFNPAFVKLMGRSSELSASEMASFSNFVMTLRYPPNPNRKLDGAHLPNLNGANPGHGEQLFLSGNLVGFLQCVSCHALPTGENGLIIPGSVLQEDQDMKVPQLRNMYEKTRFDNTASTNIRGFGYTHDGAVDDLFTFLDFPAFTFNSDSDQRDVAAFLLAFNTGTHAAIGAQWTMDGANEAAGIARVNTLVSLANAATIGLIAKGRDGAQVNRGWAYLGANAWESDRDAEAPSSLTALLALAAPGMEITFTGVPKGSEVQLGIDQDGDGYFDRDELDVGSDPGDPGSTPPDFVGVDTFALSSARTTLWLRGANPARFETRFGFRLQAPGPAELEIFDVSGRRVQTLMRNERHPVGTFETVWDLRDVTGRTVSAGLYFVRLSTREGTADKRIAVLR